MQIGAYRVVARNCCATGKRAGWCGKLTPCSCTVWLVMSFEEPKTCTHLITMSAANLPTLHLGLQVVFNSLVVGSSGPHSEDLNVFGAGCQGVGAIVSLLNELTLHAWDSKLLISHPVSLVVWSM